MADKPSDPVAEKIRRARTDRRPYEAVWGECDAYYQGRNHVFRTQRGGLLENRATTQESKPTWRSQQTRNKILKHVNAEVSTLIGSFPAPEVDPSPPADAQAGDTDFFASLACAQKAESLCLHFEDDLKLPSFFVDLFHLTVNLGEGFAYPYFDSTQGEPIGEGKMTGKVGTKLLDPLQAVWETGVAYDESPWHAYDFFYTPGQVQRFYGVKAEPDSSTGASMTDTLLARNKAQARLVRVTEYVERPSPQSPGERRIIINDMTVKTDPYPYNFAGEPGDEPWVVRFSYFPGARRDRAMGLTQHLLDPQKVYDVRSGQIDDWLKLTGNPIWTVPSAGNRAKQIVARPGLVLPYNPGLGKPEPAQMPTLPPELFQSLGRIDGEMYDIANQVDTGSLASSAAAKSINAIIQSTQQSKGAILTKLTDSYSAFYRRLLLLAREHYTEQRNLTYKSNTGMNMLRDFNASCELGKPLNVRINAAKIDKRDKDAVQTQVLAYADRQWISGEAAMLAIDAGTADELLDAIQLDISWQQFEDQMIAQLDPEEMDRVITEVAQVAADDQAQGGDPSAAPPPPGPWPHARSFDNHRVHIDQCNTWRKTKQFALLPKEVQQAAEFHVQEHERFLAAKAQQDFEIQQQQASAYGAQNAARPPQPLGQPSKPAIQSNQ